MDKAKIALFLTIFCLVGFGIAEYMKLEGTVVLCGFGFFFSSIMFFIALFKED